MSLGGRFSIARVTREGSSYGSFSTETKTPIHLLPEALGRKPMTGICGPGDLVHFSAWAKFLQPTEPLETGDLYMQTQYQWSQASSHLTHFPLLNPAPVSKLLVADSITPSAERGHAYVGCLASSSS